MPIINMWRNILENVAVDLRIFSTTIFLYKRQTIAMNGYHSIVRPMVSYVCAVKSHRTETLFSSWW